MKKLITLFSLIMCFNAQATLLQLVTDKANYQQGETIELQLIASDLTHTLGGFAAEIGFEDSALDLDTWSFGSGFDDGLGSFFFADDATPGLLYLEDYADAFADEGVISANQGVEFVLASIRFTALSAGTQTLSLLAGAEFVSFDNLILETLGSANVTFHVSQVPEPATAVLLLSCLGLLRRKRQR